MSLQPLLSYLSFIIGVSVSSPFSFAFACKQMPKSMSVYIYLFILGTLFCCCYRYWFPIVNLGLTCECLKLSICPVMIQVIVFLYHFSYKKDNSSTFGMLFIAISQPFHFTNSFQAMSVYFCMLQQYCMVLLCFIFLLFSSQSCPDFDPYSSDLPMSCIWSLTLPSYP